MTSDMRSYSVPRGGKSFPACPSVDDQFYRSDRNLGYFFNGTYWLSTTLYFIPLTTYIALTPRSATTAGVLAGQALVPSVYDTWLENFLWTSLVLTTNDGSKYWTVELTKIPRAGAVAESIVTGSTGTVPDTASTYPSHVTPINALLNTTYSWLEVNVTKVSTPGNIYLPQASISTRLVG